MRVRKLKYLKNQTYLLPCAAAQTWQPLEQAHRLLTDYALALEAVDPALSPTRSLIMAHVGRTDGLGLSPARIARLMRMPRATIAHHIDVLRQSGLVARWRRPGRQDRRRVSIVLTVAGATTLARSAELLTSLLTGTPIPDAPSRHHWNLRRLAADRRSSRPEVVTPPEVAPAG